MTGAIILHGGHQGAHRSSRTGIGDCSTSWVKLASVTVTGPVALSGVLQRPQTGSRFSVSAGCTRLAAPHEGQEINCVCVVVMAVLSPIREFAASEVWVPGWSQARIPRRPAQG